MKIAMLGHKHFPSREGGIEIVVDELATRMAALGHDVTMYDRYEIGKRKFQKESKGVHIKKAYTFENGKVNAMIASLTGSIRALFGHYDVIHYHAEGPCAFIWLPRLFRIHTVATIHGLDWNRAKWGGFATKYIKFGEKMAAKYADDIIVLSKDVQDYFWETYHRETSLVMNGISPDTESELTDLKKYGLEKGNYILYLGRLVPEKGIQYLIKAYEDLNPKQKLVIAGPLKNTEYVKELKSHASNQIIFTDFVNHEQMRELYTNCHCFVLPSELEGLSISLLEALSYGCPVIVSNIPENLDVVEDLGFKFENKNIKSLKEILKKQLSQPFTRHQNQQETILKKYDWNKVVKKTLQIYQNKRKKGEQ